MAAIERADKVVSSAEYRKTPMDLAYRPVNRDSVMVDYLAWERETVKSDLSGADWTRHNFVGATTRGLHLYAAVE